jgi:hypothetical protein
MPSIKVLLARCLQIFKKGAGIKLQKINVDKKIFSRPRSVECAGSKPHLALLIRALDGLLREP